MEETVEEGEDVEETVEETKVDVDVSALVELSEFDIGNEEDEEEKEELPAADWLVVKDILEM